jgi:hypothetical protein
VYIGSPYAQQGHGIGSFLAGLFRTVKPLAIRGVKALNREALSTGIEILADFGSEQHVTKFKEILADRLA